MKGAPRRNNTDVVKFVYVIQDGALWLLTARST